ncbi:AIPR family protein [Burkholderia pseudomallei]|uniref:AIPR family protein n=1 Tax=Burkholderia pseudomallei TaxID=28450 RepID=UPI00097791AA|nr:AIPR family protein [Burkholderia pseudomallei]
MAYIDAFKANTALIQSLGEGNAYLVWVVAMYLEEPDIEALASEALTDGPDDKKIDLIYVDRDSRRILFAQGYLGTGKKDAAPANKASDLNTASAWLLSGDVSQVPAALQSAITECREALANGEVDSVELLYVHNYPESVNVAKELQTAATHFKNSLDAEWAVSVTARELGAARIEHLFASQESQIQVKDELICPAKIAFTEAGPKWDAAVMSVPGTWLHELYTKYGDDLFSANYRGFLGISRRKRINSGIRQTAEIKPADFWVFNNGITLITLGKSDTKDGQTKLTGVSIINGAQTTGSLGTVDATKSDLKNVKVLCRVIQSTDPETIGDIVKYNNTQNEITTWDQYSNDSEQNRIADEFSEIGHNYVRKRGFRVQGDQIGIEEVAQPLLAFHGRPQDAARGKNQIFDRKPLYQNAFEGKKARHILFVYTLARAIDDLRLQLKSKSTNGTILSLESNQLAFLRNLRSKAFLIALMAQTFETVIGKKVDPLTIAFSSDAAQAQTNSLVELVARWLPIVTGLTAFTTTVVTSADLSTSLGEDKYLETVASKVAALQYASNVATQHKEFAALVSDS